MFRKLLYANIATIFCLILMGGIDGFFIAKALYSPEKILNGIIAVIGIVITLFALYVSYLAIIKPFCDLIIREQFFRTPEPRPEV